jgi:hypothetical protein
VREFQGTELTAGGIQTLLVSVQVPLGSAGRKRTAARLRAEDTVEEVSSLDELIRNRSIFARVRLHVSHRNPVRDAAALALNPQRAE